MITFSKHVTVSSSTEWFQHKSVLTGIFFPYFRAVLASAPVSPCEYVCWLIDWLRYSFGWRYCVLSLSAGINFKEVNPESTKAIFGEIHTSIDTLAFTFGNVWVLCLWDFSTQVSTAIFAVVKKSWVDLGWCLTLQPSWISMLKLCWNTHSFLNLCVNKIFSFIYLNLTSCHLSPEFLTSLWEMWTAAQGWGPPRPGEAGWSYLFQHCAVKPSSFQKSKLKA